MHIHILGICGTFMGGVAQLAAHAGHTVTGCDANVYPPMSDQLKLAGIELTQGYGAEQMAVKPDLWVIGNAVSRGNPLLEAILDAGAPYTSGPQWMCENILQGRHVIAVAGTHGKTTTTSMVAKILDYAGLEPGFLIGGVPDDFGISARLGSGRHFVIEADEYDTAFFDKRSKFVHYRPRTAVLNNLEYDHADIFENLAAIEKQFHHLVRTMPEKGLVVVNGRCEALDRVLKMGCWSRTEFFDREGGWTVEDTVAFLKAARVLGCDAADVSAGGLDKAQQMPELKPGYQVEYARVVKKETGLVTFAVGLIKEPLQAEAILAAGDADGICVGREMLRNPNWGWTAAQALHAMVAFPPPYLRAF